MQYRLLPKHREIRRAFTDAFTLPYPAFADAHREWIAALHTQFSEEYYGRMFLWDRISPDAREIRFADALALLRSKTGDVLFLTESPACNGRDDCGLSSGEEYVAVANARELVERIAYEWFTEYELFEQDCYLADRLLPEDLYVFDEALTWCIVFTHETDESESAESRLCLYVNRE